MSAIRIYNISDNIIFRKTKEEFGGLSNMAPGFSIYVNEVIIPTSEHLYQACRFPENPQLQWEIINEKSPMRAKWIGRAHIKESRKDWELIQFKVMQWALELKLSQNWSNFSAPLRATDGKNIVESTPSQKFGGCAERGSVRRRKRAREAAKAYQRKICYPKCSQHMCASIKRSGF